MGSRRISGLFFGFIILSGVGAGPVHAVTWGDVNNDGFVTISDIGPFIDVLLGDNTDPTALCAADVNADGQTDAADIPDLVDSILNGATNLLVSDNSGPCLTDSSFRRIDDDDVFNLCGGFQGATEFFITVRMAGFPSGAPVNVSYSLQYPNAESGCPGVACQPNEFCCPADQACTEGGCYIGFGTFFGVATTDVGCGIVEFASGPQPFDILPSGPVTLDEQTAILSVTVTDSNNPLTTVSNTMQVTLNTYLFCFVQEQCPPNHTCTNNYCLPN